MTLISTQLFSASFRWSGTRRAVVAVMLVTLQWPCWKPAATANESVDQQYRLAIEPILKRYCFDCHGGGGDEGGVSFESLVSETDVTKRRTLWLAVLDNVRAGLMPPQDAGDSAVRPTGQEIQRLADWIKYSAFAIDPENPDPGNVAPRRLNRVEYQNTIRDLMGHEFHADREFPPDDTGGGFDNNSEVLTLSTLLIEKYLSAAESIVVESVPQSAPVPAQGKISDRNRQKYERFFPNGSPPDDPAARDQYASQILRRFAIRAFRRPVDREKVTQLVALAREIDSVPGKTFEQGIGRAMMAVLASPHFLFRVETPARDSIHGVKQIDQIALASRLSYFLWSSMPDGELMTLAERGQLRDQLETQVRRMLADPKLETGLIRSFAGQWLRTRDIDSVEINGKAVLGKGAVNGNRATKYDFDGKIRLAMRSETEQYFAHVVREDRSVVEFIDSDYTFLNERLAKHYDIDDVRGDDFRKVKLPAGSFRGGVLTHGSVLAVTSNPTRTSPVKRGVFVLENILGTPPPPPPPDVADLDAALGEVDGEKSTLSEALARHRQSEVCSSCHDRMDPIGLAFENFIPMGNWRGEEAGRPIDASGRLITGERFADIRELKRVLANERRMDFYRCLCKKMLSYAIGRSLDYRDTQVIDAMVEELDQTEGRFSTLVLSTIDSAPFQFQQRSWVPQSQPE